MILQNYLNSLQKPSSQFTLPSSIHIESPMPKTTIIHQDLIAKSPAMLYFHFNRGKIMYVQHISFDHLEMDNWLKTSLLFVFPLCWTFSHIHSLNMYIHILQILFVEQSFSEYKDPSTHQSDCVLHQSYLCFCTEHNGYYYQISRNRES